MLVIFLSQNIVGDFSIHGCPHSLFPWVRPWVEFMRNGAKVILTDNQDDLGRAVAAELGPDPDASYARCDVTDEAQIATAVDIAVARHGRLDVLHNHAGITGRMTTDSIASLDLADYYHTMEANARSAVAGKAY